MSIRFRCAHCDQLLGIADSCAGASVDCPGCGRSILVPQSDGEAPSAATPKTQRDDRLKEALGELSALQKLPQCSEDAPRMETEAAHLTEALLSLDVTAVQPAEPAAPPQPLRFHWPSQLGLGVAMLLTGFALGWAVVRNSAEGEAAAQRMAPEPEQAMQNNGAEAAVGDAPIARPGQISGTVMWSEPGRNAAPDSGAQVLLFPADRAGDWKLDARPLRAADPTPESRALQAALNELGISMVTADESGRFVLETKHDGQMTLVVISRHVAQTDDALQRQAVEVLGQWFQNPAQITGRLAVKSIAISPDARAVPVEMAFP